MKPIKLNTEEQILEALAVQESEYEDYIGDTISLNEERDCLCGHLDLVFGHTKRDYYE